MTYIHDRQGLNSSQRTEGRCALAYSCPLGRHEDALDRLGIFKRYRTPSAVDTLTVNATQTTPENRFFSNLIVFALQDQNAKRNLLSARGDTANKLLNLMLQMFDDPAALPPSYDTDMVLPRYRIRLRRLLVRLSKGSASLPSPLLIRGVKARSMDPVDTGGGYSDVYTASHLGQKVALKRLRRISPSGEIGSIQATNPVFCKEVLIWRTLSHLHILPLLGLDPVSVKSSLCMVSPWMESGNIMRCIRRLSEEGIEIPYDRWIIETIKGVMYLHQEEIVHGDLRGANILIDSNLSIQIADFGLSRLLDLSSERSDSTHGATRWLAPEIVIHFSKSMYTSDMYAIGCLCMEIFTREKPYSSLLECQVPAAMSRGKPPYSMINVLPPYLQGPVEACLSFDPSERPIIEAFAQTLGIRPPSPPCSVVVPQEEILAADIETEIISPEALHTLDTKSEKFQSTMHDVRNQKHAEASLSTILTIAIGDKESSLASLTLAMMILEHTLRLWIPSDTRTWPHLAGKPSLSGYISTTTPTPSASSLCLPNATRSHTRSSAATWRSRKDGYRVYQCMDAKQVVLGYDDSVKIWDGESYIEISDTGIRELKQARHDELGNMSSAQEGYSSSDVAIAVFDPGMNGYLDDESIWTVTYPDDQTTSRKVVLRHLDRFESL
ncbi:unnamed protein product [Somion occarium]|uniref:Protein kinase domain-containing protein n=1 Tax=Somion occarium TaxID=3059160 RepID=A0ABP1DQC8_9APHY